MAPKPGKIVRSDFVSDKEAKLAKFCEENNIQFTKSRNVTKRGISNYEFKFEPKYLDNLERKVVEYCEVNNIGYRFVADVDGNHHYEFDGFISIGEEQTTPKWSEMPVLRNSSRREQFRKEIEFVEYDDDIKDLMKSIDVNTVPEVEPKTWWEKVKYWTYPKYWQEVKRKRLERQQKIEQMKQRESYVKNQIKQIEKQKESMREMLILADLM